MPSGATINRGLYCYPRARRVADQLVGWRPLGPLLQNGWTEAASVGVGNAAFMRTLDGWVQCVGEITAGTVLADTVLWTFPQPFVPNTLNGPGGLAGAFGRVFCVVRGTSLAQRVVYIAADGRVRLNTAFTAGETLAISGIRFPAFNQIGRGGV